MGKRIATHHFFPQSYFIEKARSILNFSDNQINFNILENKETFIDDWKDMDTRKKTSSENILYKYDSQLDNIVNELYGEDLALYKKITKNITL
jgi:hypothetical protein